MSLTAPGALWLLLAVPAVWLALRWGRTNFNPRQRVMQAVVRSALLAALALALARPVISLGSSRLSVVYVVDVSHSVASKSVTDAAARIDALNQELAPAHSRVVAFGEDVVVLDDTKALRELAAADPASSQASIVKRGASDIELALRQARAELRPGHIPRIFLFSDGRQTAGDAADAAVHLAADGVQVFVEPMAPRDHRRYVGRSDCPAGSAHGGRARNRHGRDRQPEGRLGAGRVQERRHACSPARPVTLDVGTTAVALRCDVRLARIADASKRWSPRLAIRSLQTTASPARPPCASGHACSTWKARRRAPSTCRGRWISPASTW